MSTSTNPSPTVVLVHGAYADASSWNGVVERLLANGVKVTAPANPLRCISIDSAYIASVLEQTPGPVLAVGHSYGGGVIINAATGAKNVVGLVYVAAFAPEEGETLGFLSEETVRNGEQAALAGDTVALMDALSIDSAIVAGFDWGARSADILAAVWPERCTGLVSVSGYLIGSRQAGRLPLLPGADPQWWYQYYFATERGWPGYDKSRRDFAKLIWRTASPKWDFNQATFDRSAASFDNPDHVDIVIHNYRWRLELADGEAEYDELEKRLASGPKMSVPTITLEGDANGAPHADPSSYTEKFSGPYSHRTTTCLRKHPERSPTP